jgi:hypothetical protein
VVIFSNFRVDLRSSWVYHTPSFLAAVDLLFK